MRLLSAAILGLVLATASTEALPADSHRIDALRALTDYWASQASNLGGWLGGGTDPGYVPVAPPDSSLWLPGSLLLLSDIGGFQQIGSRERFISTRSVKVLGRAHADVAILESLPFGPGDSGRFRLQDLPGVLEAFGVVRTRSDTLTEELLAEFNRCSVSHAAILLPDAQVHRLASADLEVFLEEDAPEKTLHLLSEPGVRVITSAVFLRTVQLRLDGGKCDPGLSEVLERLFGTSLKSRSDGSLKFETRGVYVAIQTARLVRARPAASGGGAAENSLVDATEETRNILARLLSKL